MCRLICLLIAVSLCATTARGEQAFEFDAQKKTLVIRTPALQLTIQGGAVTALTDCRTGEVFSPGATAEAMEKATVGAVCGDGAQRATELGNKVRPPVSRKPSATSPVTFSQTSANEAVLTYKGLSGGPPEDELRLGLRLEENGELSFRVEARMADAARAAREVYLPFVGLTPPAVIAGSGERFARNDPPFSARCMRIANNLYNPPLAVIEGAKGVIGMWPEPKTVGYDDMVVNHTPDADEVIPQVCLAFGAKDLETAGEPGVTRTSWWRLAALPSWLDGAKRYRAGFERRTGAKPLWEQSPAWVRDIHAVCMERATKPDEASSEKFYADLAQQFDPKKLLLFYWNGNCIVAFGDHRYLTNFQYPKPQEIEALKHHGFRWIGYHPYNLIFSPKGMDIYLDQNRKRGFGVPEGYTFQPDYAGPPGLQAWYDYWRPVAGGYYKPLDESKTLGMLHTGAKITREYLARNFGNYCRAHGMSGCYMDTLGADHSYQYITNVPTDRRITEGRDDRLGACEACREMKAANPDLVLMSEVQSEWTMPHTFYTWEGESHITHPTPPRLNHPMRAACWGSYTWTMTEGPEAVALLAGLPPVKLADDWSVARARLYVTEEFFNDLPEKWDPEALACYRGKGGKWFQYRRMPWGYAYVEMGLPGPKVRLGRLVNQAAFPLPLPARIQNWGGYRDGKPVGMDPARTYNFLLEPAQPEGRFWITGLPEGAFIAAIRHAETHSVVELGSAAPIPAGKVKVVLHRKCLAVSDAARDLTGPFEEGAARELETAIPGGLVFLWQEPKPADGRFTPGFLGNTGHLEANGLPYSYWTYNSTIRRADAALNGKTPAESVIEIGTGLHRGYSEQWFDLASGARPVLRFDIGYAPPDDPKQRPPRPLAWSVRVNGKEVWREMVKAEAVWRPREVPLAEFAGRRVLITLSAEETADSNVAPTHLLVPARFGHVRLTDNPLPEARPDGAALPRPGKVLFDDAFKGSALSPGWTAEISPAHGPEGRVAPEDGRLVFAGQHYKYQYIARPFPAEADTVQALVEVRPTGCASRWNPGVGLWWGPGRWAFAGIGGDGYVAELAGYGCRRIPLAASEQAVYEERFCGWVKVRLTPDKVLFLYSYDGKTWLPKSEFPRDKKYAGPPQLLLLGRGAGGPNDVFRNDEHWTGGPTLCRMGDLVAGRE